MVTYDEIVKEEKYQLVIDLLIHMFGEDMRPITDTIAFMNKVDYASRTGHFNYARRWLDKILAGANPNISPEALPELLKRARIEFCREQLEKEGYLVRMKKR